jgi:chemotaxis family two-component system response regulator PixG
MTFDFCYIIVSSPSTVMPSAIAPSTPAKPIANSTKPLVACVDDSKWVTQMMERLITTAGDRFLAIDNSIRAIPILSKILRS